MYLLDAEVSLTVTAEQVDGKNFLIRKFGIGIVTESLAVETQRRLIDITDIHICSCLKLKWDDYKHLTKVVTTASLRVVRETFRNTERRTRLLYYKRISRKVPIK